MERGCICDKLVVVLGGYTSSVGADGESDHLTINLYEGAWHPGSHEVPFELALRGYPPSYAGKLFQLSWHVVARATLWDSNDPGEKLGDVTSNEIPLDIYLPRNGGIAVWPKQQGDRAAVGQASLKPFWTFAGLAASQVGLLVYGIIAGSAGLMITGGLLGALMIAMTCGSWIEFQRDTTLGNIQLRIHTQASGGYRELAGVSHRATVWTLPAAPVKAVSVFVEAFEQVETGSRSTDNYTVRREPLWAAISPLRKTEPGQWEGELQLPEPEQAPFSLNAGWRNRIEWRATVEVTTTDGTVDKTMRWLRARPAEGPGAEPDNTAKLAAANAA